MADIKINNLQFSYEDNEVFRNLNFLLPQNKTLSIIGERGSGKTSLLKILNGDYEYQGDVYIDSCVVSDVNFDILNNKLLVVFHDYEIYEKNVKDELLYFVKIRGIDDNEIDVILNELGQFFAISNLFDKNVLSLTLKEQVLIKILSYAILFPEYLAIDDLTCFLDFRTKILLFNYLNAKNILLINVTSLMEEVLYTDYILCLYNGISAIDGELFSVLKQEKLLKRLGFSLPFMVDASIQLKLYGLMSRICLNKEDMVKELWK